MSIDQPNEFKEALERSSGIENQSDKQELFDTKISDMSVLDADVEKGLKPDSSVSEVIPGSVKEGEGYSSEDAINKDIDTMSSVEKEQAVQVIIDQLKAEGVEHPDRDFFNNFRSVFESSVYAGGEIGMEKLEVYRVMAQRPDLVKAIADDVSQAKSFENFAQLKEFAGLLAASKSQEMHDLYLKYQEDSGAVSSLLWSLTNVEDYTNEQVTNFSNKIIESYGNWAIDNKLYASNINDFKDSKVVTKVAGEN